MSQEDPTDRLRAALKAELQRNFGRIAEIERELCRSDGYLSKFCRGEISIPVDVLMKSLELLNAHPGRFFSRALGAPTDSAAFLRPVAAETPDRPLARLQKTIDQLAECADDVEDASGVLLNPFHGRDGHGDREKDRELVEAVLRCSGIEQRRRLKTARRYRRAGFVDLYIRSLIPLCYEDARGVGRQVETVVTEVLPLVADIDPEERLALALKGLSVFGFSLRMIDHLEQAAAATCYGLRLSSRFNMLAIQGELLRLGAYLLADHGSFHEALHILGQAVVIFDDIDAEIEVAKIQVQRGIVFNELSDSLSAVRALRRALRRLPEGDAAVARYRISAYGELARAHRMSGDLDASEKWLEKLLGSLGEESGTFVRGKILWERGQLFHQRNRLASAEQCYLQARDLLFSCDAPDAVLVCLDLTRLWLDQQRFGEAVVLSESMARLLTRFRKNKIKEAALLSYIRSASEGKLSLVRIESLEKAMGRRDRPAGKGLA